MQNSTTIVIIVLVTVLLLALLGGVGMMGMGGFGMMGNMMGSYGFGFSPLGAIISFASRALIIVGIVLVVVWLAKSAGKATGESSQSPLDILKMRYAKGEITKEQFEEMKQTLG